MYTMPKRATPADLDKRIPLSVTQWHLHTNLCTPRKGQERILPRQGWFQCSMPLLQQDENPLERGLRHRLAYSGRGNPT